MTDLSSAIDGWEPEPLEQTERIAAWPTAALSALLDLTAPTATDGEPLPPLWHWLSFLEHPRRSELGVDGHPAAGHFLPPIPDRRRMFAGGRLHVNEPILVGDEITRRSELIGTRVKAGRSGELMFVTIRYSFFRNRDLLMVEEQDIVYRSQPSSGQRPTVTAAPQTPPEPPQSAWTITTATDPALLFRFSALTYNTHRIHYDERYAASVEGYPGLVVHGPLLALLMLEIPRRFHPDRRVAEFEFRLARPVFCGTDVVAAGDATDLTTLDLFVNGAGPDPHVTGRARLADAFPATDRTGI